MNKTPGKALQKPVTTISPSLAQSLQQFSNAQGQQGGPNLILLDMNQEKLGGNAALADFLQSSVIVPEADGKVDIASGGEEDSDIKDDKDESGKEDAIPITTLSIGKLHKNTRK